MKGKALTKMLFMGKFNLNEEMFREGLMNHEFVEVVSDDGKVRYAWTTQEHSTARGSSGTCKMVGQENLDDNQKMLEDAKFHSWGIGLFQPSGSTTASAAPPTPLALLDAEKEMTEAQWGKAEEHLSLALQAFEKLDKDGKRALQTIGVHAKEDSLWQDLLLGSTYADVRCTTPLFLYLLQIWKG